MPTRPEVERQILAHFDSEWFKFRRTYLEKYRVEDKATIAALGAGYYSGFKAGVDALHDAHAALGWLPPEAINT